MQETVVEKRYRFVPPSRGTWVPRIVRKFRLFKRYLRKAEGVIDHEIRHSERLKESLAAGHGILLTPNHCRTADPIAIAWLCVEADFLNHCMASWHLFNMGRFMAWAIRKIGGFSVNRDGMDRQAIETAIDILRMAERPLIIFPEGYTSRQNDRLQATLDGVAFIARMAAKRRAKHQGGKVVVHPLAIKYRFQGDLKAVVDPILDEFEQRLTWQASKSAPLLPRIENVRRAFICLKELEHFGSVQSGDVGERQQNLMQHVLATLEEKWLGGSQEQGVIPRLKSLRMKIVPELANDISDKERSMRWRDLFHLELAHHLSCWSPEYLSERPSVDRILETIERLDEQLNGQARIHENLKVIIDVGEAIEVPPERDRGAKEDPLMVEVEARLQTMLTELGNESPLYDEDDHSGK